MERQPTSFIGHMYAAGKRAGRMMAAPVVLLARPVGQALERLVPHGASEVGQALYGGGSAYAPPGVTERLTQGNVHGTAPSQLASEALAVSPPSSAVTANNNHMQQAASRVAFKPQEQEKSR